MTKFLFFKQYYGLSKEPFRKTQLRNLIHYPHTNLECHHQTDAKILDFSKAFDRLPYQHLPPFYVMICLS